MRTLKKVSVTHEFVHYIPEHLEENKLYISEEFGVSVHLCLCGCGIKSVQPLSAKQWTLIKETNGTISLTPSIGNFTGEHPYHAHYIITKNVANFV